MGELFTALVPALATLIIIGIPGLFAVPATIIHVTFWRRDNRDSGGDAFTFDQIKNKIYLWGSIFGLGSVALLQGLVELLLPEQTFNWQLRVSLAAVGLIATGRVSRIAFDGLRAYTEHKGKKSNLWKQVYEYFTVTHPKKTGRRSDDKLKDGAKR